MPSWVQQSDAEVRLEWGAAGVAATAADFVVVVVLRFTTAVEAAVESGATVFPYRWKDESAQEFAASVGAVLADGADPLGPSLSPVRLQSLRQVTSGTPVSERLHLCGGRRRARGDGPGCVLAQLRCRRPMAQWPGWDGGGDPLR